MRIEPEKLTRALTACMLAGLMLVGGVAFAGESTSTAATQKSASLENWRFRVAVYGYLAEIGGEAANGKDFSVDFNDILNNLDFTVMGMVGLYKGKWSLLTDVMYLNVSADDAATLTLPLTSRISVTENVKADMNMQSWVVTPTVGYDLLDHSKLDLTLLAGLRYLYIDTTIEVKGANRFRYRENKVSDSQGNWDGIVGARGQILLTDRWYLPYYADVGTGDSELTWQVWGGVGYRFEHFDLVAGYRYMAWDFNDGDYILNDMYMSGPFVGAVFSF